MTTPAGDAGAVGDCAGRGTGAATGVMAVPTSSASSPPDSASATTVSGGRSIWPWLLLLLLLLLFALVLGLLLLDDPNESNSAEQTNGSNEPGAAVDLVPGGAAPPVDTPLAVTRADDGSTMVTVPDRPSFRLDDDARVMDLGDTSCHDQRYVLMTDDRAVPIDDLDDATVDALARSDVPIDTVALSSGVNTDALQAIAARTGGTFTQMD